MNPKLAKASTQEMPELRLPAQHQKQRAIEIKDIRPAPLTEGGLHSLATSHCHKVPGENKWKYFLKRQGNDRERWSQAAQSQGAPAWTQSLLHPSSVPLRDPAETKRSSESDSISPCSSFPPVQHPLSENKQALSYKSQIASLFKEGTEGRKENKGPFTDNPLYGSIEWELHCTKPSDKAVVLVFPEQIDQMVLFISIINIKLYFLELALGYTSALWMQS